jgi:hypothetical protein
VIIVVPRLGLVLFGAPNSAQGWSGVGSGRVGLGGDGWGGVWGAGGGWGVWGGGGCGGGYPWIPWVPIPIEYKTKQHLDCSDMVPRTWDTPQTYSR